MSFNAPKAQGLYDPRFEHDACGIGAVVNISGRRDHAIVEHGKQILMKLQHRGAAGADESTGDEGAGASDTERVTLRITRDVGEVFGVDERVYDLAAEDVVTLPAANARPLLERDAAERVE